MLLLNFLRFISGYVGFTARGGFAERFLNLCRLNKIILWDLKNNGGVISACTDFSSYKKIRSVARKSGMTVRIKRKYGLPFFLSRHKRRVGVVAGVLVGAVLLLILSTRIWSIDVIGNTRVSSEKIIGVFEELGVRKGVPASKIDIKSTEFAALERLKELSWLNINISGSKALIEVRETIESPEIDEKDNTPTDIVASRDGIITIIRPFNGTAEQKIGNAVVKGDLLISGIEENRDLTVTFCKARGYVVARTKRAMQYNMPQKLVARKPIGAKKRFEINFLSFNIPLGIINRENSYSEKKELIINGVTLPIGITSYTETVYEEKGINLSDEQKNLLGFLRFTDMCTEEFRYLEVEESEIKSDNGEFTGEFTCLENIGEEHPMQIEEIPQTETADP